MDISWQDQIILRNLELVMSPTITWDVPVLASDLPCKKDKN